MSFACALWQSRLPPPPMHPQEMLPHVGIGEFTETRKAFFVGYMVHRCVQQTQQEVDRREGVVCPARPGL